MTLIILKAFAPNLQDAPCDRNSLCHFTVPAATSVALVEIDKIVFECDVALTCVVASPTNDDQQNYTVE
jgi:hypothetical protein